MDSFFPPLPIIILSRDSRDRSTGYLIYLPSDIHHTFTSVGKDGIVIVWDASVKKRLHQYPNGEANVLRFIQ